MHTHADSLHPENHLCQSYGCITKEQAVRQPQPLGCDANNANQLGQTLLNVCRAAVLPPDMQTSQSRANLGKLFPAKDPRAVNMQHQICMPSW